LLSGVDGADGEQSDPVDELQREVARQASQLSNERELVASLTKYSNLQAENLAVRPLSSSPSVRLSFADGTVVNTVPGARA
jgi:hypothetical protein